MAESGLERSRVIFVLGGPGSGKGTVCGALSEKHGWPHYSAGDLLRAEAASAETSALGATIQSYISVGKIVPPELLMDLLKTSMLRSLAAHPGGERLVFLIDGFPRSLAQASQFESSVCPASAVLYIECDKDTMLSRCLQRGADTGRADDNRETLLVRHQQFVDVTFPVLQHYLSAATTPVLQVDGSAPKQQVLDACEAQLLNLVSS
ncbi:MAG: nucleoside monophosphate kinase [archaeon]|nr:nucleoside monophosphate kinase [archaeon]